MMRFVQTAEKVIDMEARMPHMVCEVMCWKCGKRWIAAFPVRTLLQDLECPTCGAGFAFKTGQDID